MTEATGATARFALDGELDLEASLRLLPLGPLDPTFAREAGGLWLATHTPEGPATLRLRVGDGALLARAWGPGAEWALRETPAFAGLGWSPPPLPEGASRPARVDALLARAPGLRPMRVFSVVDLAVRVVLQQRVTFADASSAWRGLVRRHGAPAPGPPRRIPAGLRLSPSARTLARLRYFDLHPLGVERRRAETLRQLTRRARRVEECRALPLAEAKARLRRLPGLGPWSVEMIAALGLGDADAVPLGDYHLPHLVGWALAGEARADDARMIQLLAPWAGQRFRVLRVLEAAHEGPPRRGPRMPRMHWTRR